MALPALPALKRLPEIQVTYRPYFWSTGSGGGTGDQGSGAPPDTGSGPVFWGPLCDPGVDPNCSSDGGAGGGGGGGGGGTGTPSTQAGECTLLNWWPCILRIIIIMLGLICVIGGLYLLKPAVVNAPLKAVSKAALAA